MTVRVEVVEDASTFRALAPAWEEARAADPDGHYFVSWPFTDLALKRIGAGWRVLVVHTDRPVAFLPLRVRAYAVPEGQPPLANRLEMAGRAAWADYTGLVCAPEHEAAALPALGGALRALPWTELEVDNLMLSDARVELLFGGFDAATFELTERHRKPNPDGVNNDICPFVPLAETFDAYAEARLSSNTRQRIRRFLRKVDGQDVRITEATPETVARDVDALLAFWKATWGPTKPDIEGKTKKFTHILRGAAERGFLYLPVLWRGERPVAANAYFVDRARASLLFKVAGRDEAEAEIPPGLVLHGHAIQWAIREGLRTYDFLRGNEPYKYSYGPEERRIRNLTVRTRTGRNLHDRLDPLALDEARKVAEEMRAKKPNRAAKALAQVRASQVRQDS